MSYRIELANKAISMKDGQMLCIGCVETFYEHSNHISWLAWRNIKHNTMETSSESAPTLLKKSQEVNPFPFESALEVHLSTSPRNAAIYRFKYFY